MLTFFALLVELSPFCCLSSSSSMCSLLCGTVRQPWWQLSLQGLLLLAQQWELHWCRAGLSEEKGVCSLPGS